MQGQSTLSYLLDTNVVSEVNRPAPDEAVLDWLARADSSALFVSVITVGEVARGVVMMTAGRKQQALESFLVNLLHRYSGRLLPIDAEVAKVWGRLSAASSRGRGSNTADELIAATALAHDLTLVTRNTRDFAASGVKLLDPWRAP